MMTFFTSDQHLGYENKLEKRRTRQRLKTSTRRDGRHLAELLLLPEVLLEHHALCRDFLNRLYHLLCRPGVGFPEVDLHAGLEPRKHLRRLAVVLGLCCRFVKPLHRFVCRAHRLFRPVEKRPVKGSEIRLHRRDVLGELAYSTSQTGQQRRKYAFRPMKSRARRFGRFKSLF